MTQKPAFSGVALFGLATLWILLLVPILFLVSVPTSVAVQGIFALITLTLIVLLKPFVRINLPVRFLVLAIASVFVLRYWIWRLTDTLPTWDDPVSFAAAVLLFLAETYAVLVFFMTALVTADPTETETPPRVRLRDVPSVDILVPSYNESDELLAVTLAAATQIKYPSEKKNVVLCDDGGTDERCQHSDPAIAEEARARRTRLQRLCADLGVTYTTRARNESAKAGNLNAALKNLTGELVVVLDADHVPSRDFLTRTVGYFVENPKLFLVQTPHFFTNRDPIERNLTLPETCPSENEMFYSTIHRGLDRLGGAFFCGSAAVLRRSAVDEVGGISGETITEDAETALDIHSRGWESKYIDHAMIAGLQPETFASFIQQRGRWAIGMTQILILKNPIFRRGLSFAQRICYLNSMSFWLFPVIRIIFILSPLLYMFAGIEIFVVTPQEVLTYILPYLLIGFLIQNALFSGVRWPQISEVYEIAQTPYLIKAIFSTVVRPRSASFNVTAKEEELDHAFLSPITVPLLLMTAVLFLGLVAGAVRWVTIPGDRAVIQIVGAWVLYNFVLASFALRAVFERPWRLVRPRTAVSVPANLYLRENDMATGDPHFVTMISSSAKSITVQLDPAADEGSASASSDRLEAGHVVELHPDLPHAADLETPLVCTINEVLSEFGDRIINLEVDEKYMVPASKLSAFIVYGDSARWHFFRKDQPKSRGLVSGLTFVAIRGVTAIFQNIVGFIKEPARRNTLAKIDTRITANEYLTKSRKTDDLHVREGHLPADPDGYLEVDDT